MRRILFRLIAASVALGMVAGAATRPQYGGTLRIELSSAVAGLTPADAAKQQVSAASLSRLIYETLTTLDNNGAPQPALAIDWRHDASEKKWQFELRPAVRFHDGQPLTAIAVAESLRPAGIETIARVAATGDTIFFESDLPLPELPVILSQLQYAVTETRGAESPGTGPFKLASRPDAQHIMLGANDDYWGGRPYLDGVQIALQQPLRQQMLDLELGKTDVIELGPGQRAQPENFKTVRSQPAILLALIFDPARGAVKAEGLRQAVALSIDRTSIWSVLLEKQGEPAAGLLPQWISGCEFLFSAASDAKAARALQVKSPPLILEYDFADPVMKAVAERIAVNVHEAGISIQVVGEMLHGANGRADMYVLRLPITSADPKMALKQLRDEIAGFDPALKLDEAQLQPARTAEQLFGVEKAFLAEGTIVPVAHLPEIYSVSARIRDWAEPALGGWPLAGVWLQGGANSAGGHP